MKRKDALNHIRVATAKGDDRTAIRIYVENRISRQAFNDAVMAGGRMRKKMLARTG